MNNPAENQQIEKESASAPEKEAWQEKEEKRLFSGRWLDFSGEPLKLWHKIIIGFLAAVFAFAFYITLDANKYPAMVRVVEGEGKIGVNPTDKVLDFGDLSRGTSAVRRVELSNNTPLKMYVVVWKTGEISDLVEIDRNFFTLAPKETVKINFTAYMPASAQIDHIYKGRVYIFKIPRFSSLLVL